MKTNLSLVRFPWLALIQVGFAAVFFNRPWIALLYPSYQAFDDFMPVHVWAWWALITSALIGLPYWPQAFRSYIRLVGFLSFTLFMLAVSAVFTLGIGPNTGSWTYSVLAAQGFVQFGQRAAIILDHCRWFQNLKGNPPSWFPSR